MKKQSGDMLIGNAIVTITTFFIAIVIILAYASWHSQLAAQDSIVLTAGTYIQSMSGIGCLNEVQKEQLLNELEQYGLKEISLDGTTETPVGYGQKVVLHITGNLELQGLDVVIDGNKISFHNSTVKQIDITRSTTSYR